MKNALTPSQGTAAVSEPWREALRTFDADLRRRGAAERTRRAYGTDAAELAAWATANGLDPDERRLPGAAPLGRPAVARRAPRRARWRASSRRIRSLFRSLLEHGQIDANPADLLPAPRLPQTLPRVAQARRRRPACSTASPPRTPLEQRDRALFELAYASGLRAEELVDLDVGSIDFDAEQVRVEGKGAKTRFVPAGEPALKALGAYLERARPALQRRRRRARAVPLQERPAAVHVRRPTPPARVGAARRDADRRAPARAPPLLRHPPAGGRRGPARDPGAAWTRKYLDDPGLHSGRVRPAAGGIREEPSAGLRGPLWRPTSKRSS